ncbi:hypothetical protein H4991_05340 [Campylobacter jejuni]|nr:hypothetical protein [Campylobacter jejuni]QMX70435.1 hypothetical protein H4991_05340 [Campylobacter jejuni]
MTFTHTQKELFNKNIEALGNILLKESLKEIKSSKFELILGKDNLDINLKDTSIKNNGGGIILYPPHYFLYLYLLD